jgi:hypothetical protein
VNDAESFKTLRVAVRFRTGLSPEDIWIVPEYGEGRRFEMSADDLAKIARVVDVLGGKLVEIRDRRPRNR